jgi:DNA-binding response OmpR family regulator
MEDQNSVTEEDCPTILVVVHDRSKAERLMPALSSDGYRIETVLSLTAPLPPLEFEPDLGIIWFPHTSTEALPDLQNIIKAIEGLGSSEPLPVLLIVDHDGAHWVEPSFQLGITDILMRPIHPLILRQRVRLLLEARHTEKLISFLKRKLEKQARKRMIHALDSALEMFRDDATTPIPADSNRVRTPFSIHSQLVFDAEQHCLIFDTKDPAASKKIGLTADQSAILLYMICHPFQALSNQEIASQVLGYDHVDEIQARGIVRPHILRLRRKLEDDPTQPEILLTIRGAGYFFSPD